MSLRSISSWTWYFNFQSQDYTVSGCLRFFNFKQTTIGYSAKPLDHSSHRNSSLFSVESKLSSLTLPSVSAFVSNWSRTARKSPHSYPVTVAWTTLKRTMKFWLLDSVVKVMLSVTFPELDLRWVEFHSKVLLQEQFPFVMIFTLLLLSNEK